MVSNNGDKSDQNVRELKFLNCLYNIDNSYRPSAAQPPLSSNSGQGVRQQNMN